MLAEEPCRDARDGEADQIAADRARTGGPPLREAGRQGRLGVQDGHPEALM